MAVWGRASSASALSRGTDENEKETAAGNSGFLFSHVFPKPYVDLLALFSREDWRRAELRGDVHRNIDKSIGKRVFVLGGRVPSSNFLALPKSGAPPLGLRGRYLYLQLRLHTATAGTQCKPFNIHLDVLTTGRFVVRFTLSSLRLEPKKAGSVYQLPCPSTMTQAAGRWTVLCLDLPELLLEHTRGASGGYHSLRGLVACSCLSLRAAFISDEVLEPETLPRAFSLPTRGGKAWRDLHGWVWLPGVPDLSDPFDQNFGPSMPLADAAPPRRHQPLSTAPRVSRPTAPPAAPGVSLRSVPPYRAGYGTASAEPGVGPLHGAAELLSKASSSSSKPATAVLSLSRVIGFSGERPALIVWLSQPELFAYATAAILVIQRIDTGEQRLLLGHTAPICAIAAAHSGPLLASAEEGALALIRLWHRGTGKCLAILQLHASDVQTIAFHPDGSQLAAVGKDARGRQLLALWDVRGAAESVPKCTLIDARVSLHHVRRVVFAAPEAQLTRAGGPQIAPEETQLVTCGFENIRFWRVRHGKLHSCGVPLQHSEGEMLLDLALESSGAGGGGDHGRRQRRLLASSSGGKVFQVDVSRRLLEYVFALHDAPINSVHLSAGFAVTGSADHKLRVWPLDFSSHFLEAEHEGPVTAVHASADGLKLLVGTSRGAIGVLDVPSQQHATLVRSHTDIVYGLAVDPHNREFATACCDGTVRIWDLDTPHQQLVEFEVASGCARCVAYHPTEYAIACGFDDGTVRIFDIASTSLLEEYTQHDGRVLALTYAHKAQRLFSADSLGSLCAYDVLHSYQPCRSYTATPQGDSPCLAVTPDERFLAVGGLEFKKLLVFECSSLRLLRTVSLTAQLHAVAISVDRTLFGACAGPSLITLRIDDQLLSSTTPPAITEVSGTHRALAEALAVSPDGLLVVSGGTDRMLKVWRSTSLRTPTSRSASSCEAYIGHSDHLTNLAFSADGNTLVSVGGGDTILIWSVQGEEMRREALAETIVEERLRQATEERDLAFMAAVQDEDESGEDLFAPADVLLFGSTEAEAEEEAKQAAAEAEAAAEAPMRAQAAERGVILDGIATLPVSGEHLAHLKEVFDQLDAQEEEEAEPEDEAEAERRTREWLSSDEELQLDSSAPKPSEKEARVPRKRYLARPVFEEDAGAEGHSAERPDTTDEDPATNLERVATSTHPAVQAADELAELQQETAPSIVQQCASGMRLVRLLGVSAYAHDHIHWNAQLGQLFYTTGDMLVLHELAGATTKHFPAGTGEISTFATSPAQDLIAVASGSGGPTCVWDVKADPTLRLRLPGHEGGVQAVAFCGSDLLVSLGIQDNLLLVQSVVPGVLLVSLQATLPTAQYVLACSPEGDEILVGGDSGLLSWRISREPTPSGGSKGTLSATRCRCAAGRGPEGLSRVTALVQLEGTRLQLAGTADAELQLWGENQTPLAQWPCSPALAEIDLLHASVVAQHDSDAAERGPADEVLSWAIVAAGAGPQHSALLYTLSIEAQVAASGATDSERPPELQLLADVALDGSAIAMSWPAGASQGVVATDAGTIHHVHWASRETPVQPVATALIESPPAPLLGLAGVQSGRLGSLLATASGASESADSCVQLWRAGGDGTALARLPAPPNTTATCVALAQSGDEGAICAAGFSDGSLALFSADDSCMLASTTAHAEQVRCLLFSDVSRLLSAAADGEIRLWSSGDGVLSPICVLRVRNGVAVDTLDVLPPLHSAARGTMGSHTVLDGALWLCGSAHQEVQVWRMPVEGEPDSAPLAQLRLEPDALLVLPEELQRMGWRCCAVFCSAHRKVIACSGVTRLRRLLFYDFVNAEPIMALALEEWPTSLTASSEAALLAVGGASGRVKLITYPDQEQVADEAAQGAALPGLGQLDSVDLHMHCQNVRFLEFSADSLFTATDDEAAQWRLDGITPLSSTF